MQSIATRLNLSVATVSRALRRVRGINPETRASVLQVATQLGYQLPKTYRTESLDDGTLQHIGVLVETPEDDLPASYLAGMTHAAMSLNASLVIHYARPETCEQILQPEFQPSAMRSGLLSGLLLIFRWPTHVVKKLSKMMPVVSLTHSYPGVDIDLVGIDNQSGIEVLVRHLHELGHRNIGFFGRCRDLNYANARFGGCVAALNSLGLEYRPDWVVDAPLDLLSNHRLGWEKQIEEAERQLKAGVTAFVCVSETAARQLLVGLTAKGIRVPEDVSITGFHRPDIINPHEIPLTSVSSSFVAMGAAGLKRVLYRIQNPAESTRTILFPCELYIGKTTGPVAVQA